ncbi:MAG: RAMP superfamily CRISPR-associated protein, partial [Verrucomicrobiota bacterium]
MKRLCQFTIKLTLSAPILTKSTAPSSFGLDAAVARDFRTGKPCLPGTLIKGKVRESLSQLGEKPAQLDVLFGKDTDSDSGNEPSRGLVIIEDLITECEEDKLARISRVAIDHCLGSAKGAMLRVIETPFRAGKPVTFTGRAACYCDNGNGDAAEIKQKLLLGLSWLTQSGALRTTGFGRVTKVEVDADKAAPLNSQTFSTAPLALDLTLLPQGPLCISRH